MVARPPQALLLLVERSSTSTQGSSHADSDSSFGDGVVVVGPLQDLLTPTPASSSRELAIIGRYKGPIVFPNSSPRKLGFYCQPTQGLLCSWLHTHRLCCSVWYFAPWRFSWSRISSPWFQWGMESSSPSSTLIIYERSHLSASWGWPSGPC